MGRYGSPAQAMLFFLTDELGFTQGFLALQGVPVYVSDASMVCP